MILLDDTDKSIEVDLDESADPELPIVASFVDITVATMAMSALGSSDTTTNDTTAVTAVAAPGAGVTRKVASLSVYNADDIAHNVTVSLNHGGTVRPIQKAQLAAGETLTYLDGVGWSILPAISILPGSVVQSVIAETSALISGSTQTPIDDTIPQSSEGNEILTCTITPTSATNRLIIEFCGQVSCTQGYWVTTALHQDSAADAVAATGCDHSNANESRIHTLRHEMAAGTTSATTFKIRIGPGAAATIYVNGLAAARKFGGVSATTLRITEVRG